MSTAVESVSETIVLLMKSTGRYVHWRIQNKRHKHIYAESLKRCIALVESNSSNFDSYRFEISQRQHYEAYEQRPTFWNKRTQERYYAVLATQHALDIADKLHARFITGAFDSEPRSYKNKGVLILGDEGIF